MKYINKTFFILLTGLMLFSCSDFLEEVPKDEISLNQFFTEREHAFNAVNTLYRNGTAQMYFSSVYSGNRAMFGQYMSGFFDNEYKGQEPHIQNAQQLTLNGNNTDDYMNGIWSDMYRAIARANNAIKYIPSTPGLTDAEMNQLMGEAKFFRGLSYFYLTRFFGEVPIITEPYESLDDIYTSRSPVSDVYALIVDDLEFSVNEAGLSESAMVTNGYRITKGAAATVLADVYLTMSGYPLQENHYADAAAMARIVINSGTYSLLENDTDGDGNIDMENSAYNKIRKEEALEEEYIYLVEYYVGISSSGYPQWTYPVAFASEVQYAITNGGYQPTDEFIWGYDEENDLRIQNKQYFHTSYTDGDGNVSTFPHTPYIWHDDEALFETANSGKDVRVYSYSEILLIAAEAISMSEGVTAEAIGYLAEVRDRAYWKMDTDEISNSLSGLSADDFVEEVWTEKFRELPFEFKLWFDMTRTRTFPLTTETGEGEIEFVQFVGSQTSWEKTLQERHLLLPLPEREIQRNPELVQNPGYDQ